MEGIVCYLIFIDSAADVPPGTYTLTVRHGLRNPISVDNVDKSGLITLTTLLQVSGGAWTPIDQAALESAYQGKAGAIDGGLTKVQPPTNVEPEQRTDQTYAPNQLLDFRFTTTHRVPRGGYVKIRFPRETFLFNSAATAVAQYSIKAGGTGNSVATIQKVIATDQEDPLCTGPAGKQGGVGCIIGVVSDAGGLAAATEYYVRLAGLRNPRHVMDYDVLPKDEDDYWEVRTYDQSPTGLPDDATNLIDIGLGGTRSILTVAPLPTFSVEPANTTNGVSGSYFITWYSEIAARDGDVLAVPFPAETAFAPAAGASVLACEPTVGSLRVSCTFKEGVADAEDARVAQVGSATGWKYGPEHLTRDASYKAAGYTYNLLEMKLTDIETTTGLYKVKVDAVTNPPSRRGSSPFGRVTHKTAQGFEIQEYRVQPKYNGADLERNAAGEVQFDVSPVTIETDAASALQDVHPDDITQHTELYDKVGNYELRFQPYSVVRAVNGNGATLKLTLTWPKQVIP